MSRIDQTLPDTMNLRVWDAGRPRWGSPFTGASHDERNTGCSKGDCFNGEVD
jgi:hypothetical protein